MNYKNEKLSGGTERTRQQSFSNGSFKCCSVASANDFVSATVPSDQPKIIYFHYKKIDFLDQVLKKHFIQFGKIISGARTAANARPKGRLNPFSRSADAATASRAGRPSNLEIGTASWTPRNAVTVNGSVTTKMERKSALVSTAPTNREVMNTGASQRETTCNQSQRFRFEQFRL